MPTAGDQSLSGSGSGALSIPTHPYNSVDRGGSRGRAGRKAPGQSTARHLEAPSGHPVLNHTIFEGPSEIQQLVISRAISGLRIE